MIIQKDYKHKQLPNLSIIPRNRANILECAQTYYYAFERLESQHHGNLASTQSPMI